MSDSLTKVTIVVVPRDRFSSIGDCVRSIIENTDEPYRLVILDFGYSDSQLRKIREIAGERLSKIVHCGRTIPLAAFQSFLPEIQTPYVAWIDNDTFVTSGWLTALLNRSAHEAVPRARVILPVTLEREGLDIDSRGIPLRNHISHSELRGVSVNGETFVFDHKPYRRAAPEVLPQEPHTVDFFELHTFFAETEVLRQLSYPRMVVREHVDLGIQLHNLGIDIWCEPKSVVLFDNIHNRPSLSDLRFFLFRWNEKLIDQSHQLFYNRWGYRFLNEQFLKNWAFRRKVYSVCRFFGLPQYPSDFVSRVMNKLFRPPLPKLILGDALSQSTRIFHPEPCDRPENSSSACQPIRN